MAVAVPKLNKTQIKEKVAGLTGLTTKQIGAVLDALSEVACGQLGKKNGEFTLPGLVKLKSVKKPATKERQGRNPKTGEPMTIKAKPARTVVKARALKAAKEAVLA